MLEGLLGQGGGPSLQGLAGSLAEALLGDGSPDPEGFEGGPGGEAAADEEEEQEDYPRPMTRWWDLGQLYSTVDQPMSEEREKLIYIAR